MRGLLLIMYVIISVGVRGQTPSPTPTPCPTPDCLAVCASPTTTITPTASPTPIPTGTYIAEDFNLSTSFEFQSRMLEAKYASFGSRWVLKPHSEIRPYISRFGFAPPPLHNSNHTVNYPNSYAPLVSQGVYRDDMWFTQSIDFAPRTIFMLGTASSSLMALDSGVDKTRKSVSTNRNAKYAIGALNQAGLVKGGVDQDLFHAFGATNFGFTSFSNPYETEPGTGKKRVWATNITGSENFASVSRWVAPFLTGSTEGSVDARHANIKEDDSWNPAGAVVSFMYGSTNTATVDNKRLGYCEGGKPAGSIAFAAGVRALVLAFVQASYVNVGEAYGTQVGLAASHEFSPSNNYFCSNNERSGSRIGKWIGVYVTPTTINPNNVCLETDVPISNAAFLSDQLPESAGGAASRVADSAAEGIDSKSISVDRYATIVSRGDAVFGDGDAIKSRTGYDTDVLHVEDVIHLRPRTEPPQFDSRVPPSDRVGLLYFDLSRNALRISVAASTVDQSWESASVVWQDVLLDETSLQDSDVINMAPSDTTHQVKEKMNKVKIEAMNGSSPFIPPSLEVIMPTVSAEARGESQPVGIIVGGFDEVQPQLYWRRLGRDPDGSAHQGWTAIQELHLIDTLPGGIQSYEVSAPFAAANSLGQEASPNQVVQFLAVHPETHQTAGKSVFVGGY